MSTLPPPPPDTVRGYLRVLGPGLVVAATGVGAGDLIAAGKAGAAYGLVLLWAPAIGALLKLGLAEGVARWQLATGTHLLEGWLRHFGWPVRVYFLAYLLLWSISVSAALMSACGLAGHALVPALSVTQWAIIHSVLAFAFVWLERYSLFERLMAGLTAVMFVTIIGAAILQAPPAAETLRGLLVPSIPVGSVPSILSVMGGVGGTLTLLSYSYWIRERGWSGVPWLRAMRFDLGVGYLLTGLFGVALVLLGGVVLHPSGAAIEGNTGALQMAAMLGQRFGRAGELIFLVGFWAAVATSILGVWQGVPYLFAHFIAVVRNEEGEQRERTISARSPLYRGFLAFLAFPPMLLLLLDRPVWLVTTYAAVGSLFMPFLAATLLVMLNRREWVGTAHNRGWANLGLILCLLLFGWLGLVGFRSGPIN